nr:MAG: capsid protein [Totiviridae sp.]
MSTRVLDQLCGPLLDVLPSQQLIARHVKYGTTCEVKYHVTTTQGAFSSNRPNALFTNMLTPFGTLSFNMVNDQGDFDGFNNQMINEYGLLDENLVCEALKRTGAYRPSSVRPMAANIAGEVIESHVSVLFNLLRMKLIAEIDFSKVVVKPSDVAYDDGHVAQNYAQFLGRDFDVGFEMKFNDNIVIARHNENTRVDRGDYLPNLYGFTAKEVSILGMALAGWTCDYPLRIASSTPQLCGKFIIPFGTMYGSILDIVDYSARDVDVVLRKLVANNRLDAQFDLAYTLLAAVIYTPLPRAVEANGWVSPNIDFNLPRAGSVRGMIDEFTQGNAFQPRPTAMLTWETYKLQPTRLTLHAIAMTEALYTGLFEVLTNRNNDLAGSLAALGLYGSGSLKPYRFMMECASYRFGKRFELKWDAKAGPDFTRKLLSTSDVVQNQIEVSVVGDASGYEMYTDTVAGMKVNKIRARAVKPVLFPVLSLGINDDRYYLNALDYNVDVTYSNMYRGLFAKTAKDANKFMSIMRIGGWDVVCHDTISGAGYRNWAANSNGQVMPMVTDTTGMSSFIMPIAKISRREHSWMDIPRLNSDMNLRIQMRVKSYAIVINGKLVNMECDVYKPIQHVPRIYSEGAATEVTIMTRGDMSNYEYSDFILALGVTREQPESLSEPVGIMKLQHTEQLVSAEQPEAALPDDVEI